MMDTETGVDSPRSKKEKKEKLKYSFSTIERYPADDYCHYSDLPAPSAYIEEKDEETDS